jgi:hypothetical protein
MGLPSDWSRVKSWLYFKGNFRVSRTGILGAKKSKWSDIPVLEDYSRAPEPSFWSKFPKKELPVKPETSINIDKLEKRVRRYMKKMTVHQIDRSLKAVQYLREGAPSFQETSLPACYVKNASSTTKHGKEITENIATWVDEGYAAGPFDSPPCPNFRVNPLIAVVQPGKVRPVLDVSSPHGDSYNSTVDEFETETVKMSSAKQFAQLLNRCGDGATISKHDLVAAYKQVPCRIQDLRLQGFSWLGKYFVETRQVFGAKTSVCNYDVVGETLKLLAILESGIPSQYVLRQVDDVPVAAPSDSGHCETFSHTYKEMCRDLNVQLAPDCPLQDKAFTNQKRGKVLGVMFDTKDMTWRLSDTKIYKAMDSVKRAINAESTTLKECQRLIGRLNDVGQMCPLMKIFRQPINMCLSEILSDADPKTVVQISQEARRDLAVWAGFLTSDFKWLPIAKEQSAPPIWHKEFVSDAAGLADKADIWKKPGCGNVGFAEDGTVVFANQLLWDERFITEAVDEKGVRYGDKTTTLEVIGLLIPLVVAPELFVKSNVVLKVDCFGTVYGMENRASKGDTSASVFIRSVYLIAAYLECSLHVVHLPRLSDWGAEVADRLSRDCSTTMQDRKLVNAFKNREIPDCLKNWFANPHADWNLPFKLLEHVEKLV